VRAAESTEQKKANKTLVGFLPLAPIYVFLHSNRPKKCMRVLKAFTLTQWQNKTIYLVSISHKSEGIIGHRFQWVVTRRPCNLPHFFHFEVEEKVQKKKINCY
jgi:hypothetical protein